MIGREIAVLLVLVCVVGGVSATSYYVNNATGSDAYSTAQAQNYNTPWLTMQKANTASADGDTIYVGNGGVQTYPENDTNYRTFAPTRATTWIANGTITVIKGNSNAASSSPIYLSANKAQSFDGFIFDAQSTYSYVVMGVSPFNGTVFRNCTFQNSTQRTLYSQSSGYMSFFGGSVFETGLPSRPSYVIYGPAFDTFEGVSFNTNTSYFSVGSGSTQTLIFNNCSIVTKVNSQTFNLVSTTTTLSLRNSILTVTGSPYNIMGGSATAGTVTSNGNRYSFVNVSSATGAFDFSTPSTAWTTTFSNDIINVTGTVSKPVPDYVFQFKNQTSPVMMNNITVNTYTTNSVAVYIYSAGATSGSQQITQSTFNTRSTSGYDIAIGSENQSTLTDNKYDGSIITGNTFNNARYWNTSVPATSIQNVFVGHQVNALVRDNTFNGGGLAIVLKASPMTYTTGGIFNNTFVNCLSSDGGIVLLKGVRNTSIESNNFTNTLTTTPGTSGIYILENTGVPGSGAINNRIAYNTMNNYNNPMVDVDANSTAGFSANGDSYTTAGPNPISFIVGPSTINFTQWQALGYDVASGSLLAMFTPNKPLSITTQQVVAFWDQSTGSPTSWTWNFGDGTSTTGANVSHFWGSQSNNNVTETVCTGSTCSTNSTWVLVYEPQGGY